MRRRIISAIFVLFLTAILVAQSSAKVYVTAKGKKYHTATCKTIKKSVVTELTKEQAVQAGYEPCGICKP